MEVCKEALQRGIEVVKPGAKLGDIGASIQSFAEGHGYSIVREFCGHGIGSEFHEEPQILHYGNFGEGLEIKEGMVFTIEPMVNLGKPDLKILADKWTAVTLDGQISAQFEHTLCVTDNGVDVMTRLNGKTKF